MKLIGVLGGMSWEPTALYYRLMNETVRERLGKLHSARLLLHSVDFQPIEQLQHAGNWSATAEILGNVARGLKDGGADFLVIATNTMHKVADEISSISGLEILHIADPTGSALVQDGIKRVALLGTRFTMEQDFYRSRLQDRFNLDVMIPEAPERTEIHRIVYDELCRGIIKPTSAARFREIIDKMDKRGTQAVILGCTEITMIVDPTDCPLPVYDTTSLHAVAAVEKAMGED